MSKITITVRQTGDRCFFLTNDGFKVGRIKSVLINQDNPTDVHYRICEPIDASIFMGHERKQTEVFDTLAEMIDYYSNKM